MRKRTWARLVPIVAALALVATGCGESGGGGGGGGTVTGLEILVGTAPGGGFDQTARTAAQVMEDAKLARVSNVPGAGNTVALAQLVNQEGNGKVMQQMGLSVVGNVYTNKSKATLDDTTPIARLTQEPEIVVVGMEAPPNLGTRYTSEFRKVFPELAERNGATLLPFLLLGVAAVDSLNQGDGIHPNSAGSRRLAETVWSALLPLLEQRDRVVSENES